MREIDLHSAEPPPELISQIFPWVEAEEAALDERERSHGRPGRDIALKGFLRLLKWFRRVLLQDAAVLFTLQPSCAIFGFSPFRSMLFHDFALKSVLLIQQANEDSRLALQHLPHQYAQSMQGFMLTTRLAQERASHQHSEQLAEMRLQISHLEMIATSHNTRHRGRGESLQCTVIFFIDLLTRNRCPCRKCSCNAPTRTCTYLRLHQHLPQHVPDASASSDTCN